MVTFATYDEEQIRNSPIIDLQQQQLLLRMEYEYEKEEFKRQTETMGVARKVKTRTLLVSCLSWTKLLQFAESASNRNYTHRKYRNRAFL